MKCIRFLLLLVFCAGVTTTALAEEKIWGGFVENNSWSNPENWVPSGVPQTGDDLILSDDNISGDIVYDDVGGVTLRSLEIWGEQGLILDPGYLLETMESQKVGLLGTANFKQNGGINTVGTNLFVGFDYNEDGYQAGDTYDIEGGTLNVNQNIVIGTGEYGKGHISQREDSTVDVKGMLIVGDAGGGIIPIPYFEEQNSGDYKMYSPESSLTVHGNEYIGAGGIGTFYQYDGTHNVTSLLTIGQYSTGGYRIDEGELTVLNEIIGQEGTGAFFHKNGIHNVQQDLVIAATPGAAYESIYYLYIYGGVETLGENGQLNVGNDFSLGQYAKGVFIQEQGSVNVDNELRVGDEATGTGEYYLGYSDYYRPFRPGFPLTPSIAPGVIQSVREYIGFDGTGYFLHNHGDNIVIADMSIGHNEGSNGTYDLDVPPCIRGVQYCSPVKLEVGGYLRVGNAGTGTFNQSSGDVYVGANAGEGLTVQYQPQAVGETAKVMAQQLVSSYNMSGGTLTVGQVERDGEGNEVSFTPAQIVNNGLFNIHDGGTEAEPILVRGDIINNKEFSVTNANVRFDGSFTNNGAFHSDPSTMHFTNLYIGADGYLAGQAGDAYQLSGNFSNESTQNTLWQTRNAQLIFEDAVMSHQLLVNSLDDGPVITAYDDNFAWGTVDFGGEDSEAEFLTGSLALYTGSLLGLVIDADGKVVNLSGDSNVYYIFNPSNPGANGYLNGQTYAFLSGKGQVIPVVTPEPAAVLLYGIGGLPLAARFLRRRKNN